MRQDVYTTAKAQCLSARCLPVPVQCHSGLSVLWRVAMLADLPPPPSLPQQVGHPPLKAEEGVGLSFLAPLRARARRNGREWLVERF